MAGRRLPSAGPEWGGFAARVDMGNRKAGISAPPFELGVVERRLTSGDRAGRDQILPRIPDEAPLGAEAPRNIAEYLEDL